MISALRRCRIGDIDVALSVGGQALRRIEVRLATGTVLKTGMPSPAKGNRAVAGNAAYAIVGGVGDIDHAGSVSRDALRTVELAAAPGPSAKPAVPLPASVETVQTVEPPLPPDCAPRGFGVAAVSDINRVVGPSQHRSVVENAPAIHFRRRSRDYPRHRRSSKQSRKTRQAVWLHRR